MILECAGCGNTWNSKEGKRAKYCTRACYDSSRKKAVAEAGPNRFPEQMTLFERMVVVVDEEYGVKK